MAPVSSSILFKGLSTISSREYSSSWLALAAEALLLIEREDLREFITCGGTETRRALTDVGGGGVLGLERLGCEDALD